MSGIAEVQARISMIDARLAELSTVGRRARVDPMAADAFAATLGEVQAASSTVQQGAPVVGPSRPTGEDVVAAAREYLGVPYRWGGTDPATGLDCSGLVQRVLGDLGIDAPRTVADQRNLGTPVATMADARPGDLLVYASESSPSGRHIGIYVGDGQMLHAPRTGEDVQVGKAWSNPTAIRRVMPEAATTSALMSPAPGTTTAGAATGLRPAWASAASGSTAYDAVFADATRRYQLPQGLLAAVAQQESGMRPDAVSPAGAVGLMQLMPGTARELGVDPRDPAQAVDGAARYLRTQLDAFGSLDLALAAYNAGPGNVRKHGGVPPFAETRSYVAAITGRLAASGGTT